MAETGANREYRDRLFKFIFGKPIKTRGANKKKAILRCLIMQRKRQTAFQFCLPFF